MAAAGAHASSALEADLTLGQVAAKLLGIIGKPVSDIFASGVVNTLHAAELVDLLRNEPALSLLAQATKDDAKRRKLESTQAQTTEALDVAPGAVAAGADPCGGGGDVDMLSRHHMDRQTSGMADPTPVVLEAAESNHSWQIEDAFSKDDSASSSGTVLTLRDYNWLEHPDVTSPLGWPNRSIGSKTHGMFSVCWRTKSLRRRRRCLTPPSWTSLARTTLGGALPALSLEQKINTWTL